MQITLRRKLKNKVTFTPQTSRLINLEQRSRKLNIKKMESIFVNAVAQNGRRICWKVYPNGDAVYCKRLHRGNIANIMRAAIFSNRRKILVCSFNYARRYSPLPSPLHNRSARISIWRTFNMDSFVQKFAPLIPLFKRGEGTILCETRVWKNIWENRSSS